MTRPHAHACQSCQATTVCHGKLAVTVEGPPGLVCPEFHRAGGTINQDFLCPTCAEKVEADQRVEAL